MVADNPIPMSSRVKDAGREFGQLRAIRLARYNSQGKPILLCLCDPELGGCGRECEVRRSNLRSGHTRSCGCLASKRMSQWDRTRNRTHGLSHRDGYRSWTAMIRRCTSLKHKNYNDYGGRGIKVCERWLGPDGFANFLADMGPRPSPKHQIERLDNDKGYSPDNCVWATHKTQARNRRTSRLLTFDGRTQCISAWAEQLGLGYATIAGRLKRGWTVQQALETP